MKPSWHWTNQSPEKVKETLDRISASRKGQHSSPETQFKIGYKSPRKGKPLPWAKKAADGRRSSGMYEKMKGNTFGFTKGSPAWNKGRSWDQETKDRIGVSRRAAQVIPWNKGQGVGASLGIAIRGLPEYTRWRLAVFTRDNFTCQHCGDKGVQLHADHIKPFALICRENNIDSKESAISCKALWNIRNGQTLCIPCHRKTETFSGKQQTKLYQFPRP